MATSELPSGTITFLFSDIEGSTRLLEELGDGYVALLQEHNRIFREVIREYEGAEVSTEGDSFFVVFRSPLSAVDAAARIQRRLADAPFPATVRVRMGLHTGQGHLAGGDYVGIDVNRAARIAAAGHGGQILVSDATRALVEPDLPATLALRDLGLHRLKDLVHPERLYQLFCRRTIAKVPSSEITRGPAQQFAASAHALHRPAAPDSRDQAAATERCPPLDPTFFSIAARGG